MFRLVTLVFIGILVITMLSCAGDQQLVAEKQARIDSLITLNSSLRQKLEKLGEQEKELARLKQLNDSQQAELGSLMKELSAIRDVEVTENKTIITSDLLFRSGSFQITDEGKRILNDIWSILEKYPDREILIIGHTDDRSIAPEYINVYRSNWDLSTWRALAVLHYLDHLPDANTERLAVMGCGASRPRFDNTNEEGRRKNRRVEIIVGLKTE